MNLNIQSVSNYISTLFEQASRSILKSPNQKIVAAAIVMFASIGALYCVARRCLFKATPSPAFNEVLFFDQKEGGKLKTEINHPSPIENGNDLESLSAKPIVFEEKIHGKKKITLPDGTIFDGEFEEGEFKKGKITYKIGRVFSSNSDAINESEKKQMKPIVYPNGTILEGEFDEGELNGMGKIIYPKTLSYPATIPDTDTPFSGKGMILEGEFKHGFLHGQGKKICSDNKWGESQEITYVGRFQFGRFVEGKYVCNDNIQEGEFDEYGHLKEGKIKWKDGSIEEGSFQYGQLRKGKIEWINGIVTEGTFIQSYEGGKTHNFLKGMIRYPDGRIEEGTFRKKWDMESYHDRQALEGIGKVTHPDGKIEIGFFLKGVVQSSKVILDGKLENGDFIGKITYPEGINFLSKHSDSYEFTYSKLPSVFYSPGTILEGQFSDSELNGKGKIICPTQFSTPKGDGPSKKFIPGFIAEGEFKKGYLNGQGKLTFPNGKNENNPKETFFEGKFVYNQFIEGTCLCAGEYRKEGQFKNDDLNGKGKATWEDGRIEEGDFQGDCVKTGKITWGDGTIEEGLFQYGRLKNGKVTWKNGVVEEGDFSIIEEFDRKEKHQLNGVITYPDGKKQEGTFFVGWNETVSGSPTLTRQFHDKQALNGIGKITHRDGKVELGLFIEGVLSDEVICEGNLNQDSFKGKMTLLIGRNVLLKRKDFYGRETKLSIFYPEGTCFEGEFKKSELNGNGKVTWKDGKIEEGRFEGNCLIRGKVVWPNQVVEEGLFQTSLEDFDYTENKFKRLKHQLKGSITYPDGKKEDGIFVQEIDISDVELPTLTRQFYKI